MPAPTRHFEVSRITLSQLIGINTSEQTFRARLFVEFLIRDGEDDEHLMKQSDEWPTDTNLPSALWYANQMQWTNAVKSEFEVLDCNVFGSKGNIVVQTRVEGTFTEKFELQSFPYDCQSCTFIMMFACAQEGHIPVAIDLPPGFANYVDVENFTLSNHYHLDALMDVSVDVSRGRTRTFPILKMTARARRVAGFYEINVCAPLGSFVLMTLTSFCLEPDNVEGRLSVSLTMVLVAVAYKFALTTMLPPLSYLTLLDKYVLACSGIIALIVAQNAVLGLTLIRNHIEVPAFEAGCVGLVMALLVALHVWFVCRVRQVRAFGDNVKSLIPQTPAGNAAYEKLEA